MADLSKQQNRRTTQERPTNNRDYIMPRARQDDLPGAEIRADLRSAQRGDGDNGLARALGMMGQAVESYARADIAKTAETARVDYADGLSDAAAGLELNEAERKSIAYERAYHGTMAAKAQSEWERETGEAITALVNSGGGADDIQALIDERSQAFVQATVDRYDDAEIKQRVGTRLINWTADRSTAALNALKEKTDAELLSGVQSEVANRLQRNEPLDFEGTIAPLIEAGMDPNAVKTAVVDSTIAYAIETRNREVLFELLDSRREGETESVAFAGNPPVVEGAPLPPVNNAVPAPEVATPTNYIMPLDGPIRSGIGPRRAPIPGASTNHNGLDIAVPVGTPVAAMGPGRVTFAARRGNNGNLVTIEHPDGTKSNYAHLDSIGVKVGDTVSGGQQIARSGNTGKSSGPHLHLTVRDAHGRVIDPRSLVGKDAGSNPSTPTSSDGPSREEMVAAAKSPNGPPVRDRPAGTSSLSATERMRVANAIVQVEGMAERDKANWKEESKDALILQLDETSKAGGDITPLLRAAQAEGYLDPLEAHGLEKTFRGIEDFNEEGELNNSVLLDYQERMATERPDYAAIRSQATRDYEAGRFGTGTAARQAYISVLSGTAAGQRGNREADIVGNAAKQSYRGFVSESLGGVIRQRTGGQTALVTTQDRRNAILADQEYLALIAGGMDPQVAADRVVNKWSPLLLGGNTGTPPPPAGRQPGGRPTTRQPGNAPRRVRVNANGEIISGD